MHTFYANEMKMRAEIAKNKFSDIGLASRKVFLFTKDQQECVSSEIEQWLSQNVLFHDFAQILMTGDLIEESCMTLC